MFVGFVEEIYRAQKLRDIAMMERLKETNQARHFALALANQRYANNLSCCSFVGQNCCFQNDFLYFKGCWR